MELNTDGSSVLASLSQPSESLVNDRCHLSLTNGCGGRTIDPRTKESRIMLGAGSTAERHGLLGRCHLLLSTKNRGPKTNTWRLVHCCQGLGFEIGFTYLKTNVLETEDQAPREGNNHLN